MFTDANQIQVLIIGGSEPVGILSKFSNNYVYYGGGESEKEGGKSHGGSLYSFWLKIAGPLSITIK